MALRPVPQIAAEPSGKGGVGKIAGTTKKGFGWLLLGM
jgi:hypothetical protein